MSNFIHTLQQASAEAIKSVYELEVDPSSLPIQETRKDFEGTFTLVVFSLSRYKLGAPQQIGESIGQWLVENVAEISGFNVVKGFLNLSLHTTFWQQFLHEASTDPGYYKLEIGAGKSVVVEYCSPNTNKPLHLGHLRNIVLGYSLSKILEACGYDVHQTCLFNDRGSNISKSMVAWQQAALNDSPDSTGKNGDKFVGDYYVAFANQYKAEVAAMMEEGMDKAAAEKAAPIMKAVHEMTVAWEEGNPEIRGLWTQMNQWVYDSFEKTFERLGIKFEKYFYESQVYQRGKESVQEGLDKGIFYTTEAGSVEVDLEADKLGKKTLLRSNGTSLYITQDLAVAQDKYDAYQMDKSIYVVGNEQDHHFKVLFNVLQKLEKPYGEGLFHLSYGMVELTTGKMKSREGTTVEADDLMDDMTETAKAATLENPDKIQGLNAQELHRLYEILGIGGLKYFLVKVDPKKRILFKPEESIQLQGNTGPFIQYSYARNQAIKRKAEADQEKYDPAKELELPLLEEELSVLQLVFRYPEVLGEACDTNNPALMANYAYELAKEYNRFYHEAPILKCDSPHTRAFRFALSNTAGETLKQAMELLGISMPDRM
ncbi:MAG: arginine--tRNA ligase [Bacteroidota bacterium]